LTSGNLPHFVPFHYDVWEQIKSNLQAKWQPIHLLQLNLNRQKRIIEKGTFTIRPSIFAHPN
jgi:hypothetical protein